MTAVEKILAKAASGEKFTADEVVKDAELLMAADKFVRTYDGDFDFVLDLKGKINKYGLSAGQAKGALNVMIAGMRPEKPKVTVDAAKIVAFFKKVDDIKNPRVRLMTFADGKVTIKLKTKGKWAGTVEVTGEMEWNDRFGEYAPHWYGRIAEDGTVTYGKGWNKVAKIVSDFAKDPAGTAAEYGKLTGSCSFCNLPLTDERSLAVGYGPVCAVHYGLPWGEAKYEVPAEVAA